MLSETDFRKVLGDHFESILPFQTAQEQYQESGAVSEDPKPKEDLKDDEKRGDEDV